MEDQLEGRVAPEKRERRTDEQGRRFQKTPKASSRTTASIGRSRKGHLAADVRCANTALAAKAAMITASDFREVVRNTLRGFMILTLSPSGIRLRECALHEKDGKRWIGLPSKPQLDAEDRHRIDPATGKNVFRRRHSQPSTSCSARAVRHETRQPRWRQGLPCRTLAESLP
jgi:hypothetical protein